MNEEAALVQLSLIEEVSQLLRNAGVPCWLFGGWGVDFLAGCITRPHEDVDFMILKEDAPRVEQLLSEQGFTHLEHPYPDEDTIWQKHSQKLEFYFLEKNECGQMTVPGRWKDWPMPPEAFSVPPGRIGQIKCLVVSAEAQFETKRDYTRYTGGASLRTKDRADLERLRRLLE